MRRFYVEPATLGGDHVELPSGLSHRLASVLRLRAGDEIALFDGSGEDVILRLRNISDRAGVGDVVERRPGPAEASTQVALYQSITKGERFEWLLEKTTELGVARVTPTSTARSVVRPGDRSARADRWQRIVVEAAEQCGRSRVPEVAAPQTFSEALRMAPGVLLLPYESADAAAPSIAEALGARIDELFATAAISIFVGPEGGFEEREVAIAVDAGAVVVTLGDRVLRSETAGLVALTLVMSVIGELG